MLVLLMSDMMLSIGGQLLWEVKRGLHHDILCFSSRKHTNVYIIISLGF